jgi:hypothetical protein
LSAGEDLGSGEVLKVLMVGDNVYGNTGTFKVVPPNAECLKDCKKFFVVSVIV